MEKIVERLVKWSRAEKAPPHKILVYPTNRCNLKCPFCFQRLNPYDFSKDLPHKRWIELTDELCKMGIDVIQISGGGEPMIVRDTCMEMMKIIKSNGVSGRLVNNGTLWNERDIKTVVNIGWDNVIFSVDGATSKVNDQSRGVPGTFEKVIKNIKLFNKYKKDSKADIPKLEFSTVVTKFNYFQLGDMIRLGNNLNIHNITFEPVFVSNPEVENIKVSRDQREFVIRKINEWKEVAKNLNIMNNLDDIFHVKDIEKTGDLKEKIMEISKKVKEPNPFLKIPCYEPWIWPKIEADGRVGPCSTIYLSDFCKEDVNVRNRSFEDVWYGEEFMSFRKSLIEGKLVEACANCVSTHLSWNMRIREELRRSLD